MLSHLFRIVQGSKIQGFCRSRDDSGDVGGGNNSFNAFSQPCQREKQRDNCAQHGVQGGAKRRMFGLLKLHSNCPSKDALTTSLGSPHKSSTTQGSDTSSTARKDPSAGHIRWESAYELQDGNCRTESSSSSSSISNSNSNKSSELYCPACGELGGALLCHECGPRPDNSFLIHYRRSYMYAALDAILTIAEFIQRSFRRLLPKYFCTGGGKSEANAEAGGAAAKQNNTATSYREEKAAAHRGVRRRQLKGHQEKGSSNADRHNPADEHQRDVQQRRAERSTETSQQQLPLQQQKQLNKQGLPSLRESKKVTYKFWATVNFLEDLFVSFSLRHPLLVWVSWSLLSIGFYCVLNCMLWPLLIVLFVYRRVRFYAWGVVVRWRRSIVFSDDLLARLQQQMKTCSRSGMLLPLPVPRRFGTKDGPIEVLSLMESQEKLFFSMPWMAVTGFAYCERLSFQELCMAITQKLLRPKTEFACLANCAGGSNFLDQLPLSAFLHPRLLAKVQRVMGRYCWVRQPGFQVSQQVVKCTKKGIDVLRQQHCAARQDTEAGADKGNRNSSCSCRSTSECNCLMDETDVLCLVNEAQAQPLDPMKPLWQFLYLENVILPPNPVENPLQKERIGSAVLFRMHHAVGDGISITRMFLKDFLCSAPAHPGCSVNDKPLYHTDAAEQAFLPEKVAFNTNERGAGGASSYQSSTSASNDAVCIAQACDSGSPVSAASTSTIWTVSGLSLKASAEGNDSEKCVLRSSQEEAPSGSAAPGATAPAATQAAASAGFGVVAAAQVGALQKPPISICSIPNTVFWRFLVAARFALQLPFYGAGMAMLLSYDELLKAPRSGSANRTRIASPICLPLQELKDLKTRLTAALAQQQQQQQQTHAEHTTNEATANSRLLSRLVKYSRNAGGTKGKNNGIRLTLNDIFATCIVGGYYRCTTQQELEERQKALNSGVSTDTKKPLNASLRKEQMNFVVPVNLRHAEEEAMDLRNRFASLIIQMPITPQGDSLQR